MSKTSNDDPQDVLSQHQPALGLLTTLVPKMEIDVGNPLAMAQTIEAHVRALERERDTLLKDREVTIVCEGPCNPKLKDLDAAVAKAVTPSTARKRPTITPEVLEGLGKLVHTRHDYLGKDQYACSACGTVRRF